MPNPVIASIFRALCNVAEGLTRTNIRAHEEELLGLEVSQTEMDIALSKSVSSQQSCAAKKPKLTSNAISDVNDLPNFDPDEAAHRLRIGCASTGAALLGRAAPTSRTTRLR